VLDVLISNKTRIKLLFRFFLNPGQAAYLRGLEKEFDENSNSIRMELNRFESAGILSSYEEGNKKMYAVNTSYPLFTELQSLAMKHFGVDKVLDQITGKLGKPLSVYLTGNSPAGSTQTSLTWPSWPKPWTGPTWPRSLTKPSAS